MDALKLYIRAIEKLSEWVGRCVSLLVPAMVVVLFIEVIARYFFESPTLWAYDTAIFMFGYCGLLAGAYAMKHDSHINVDLVYNLLSKRGKAILSSISYLLFFFFMVLVIIYAGQAAWVSLSYGDRTSSHWAPPLGHFKLMIPVGAALLLLQGLAKWIRYLHLAVTGKDLDP